LFDFFQKGTAVIISQGVGLDIKLLLWVYDKFATRCDITLWADVKIGPGRKTKGHVYNYTRLLAKSQKNSRLFRGDCEIWAGANLGPKKTYLKYKIQINSKVLKILMAEDPLPRQYLLQII
jgi:hypothetical protein